MGTTLPFSLTKRDRGNPSNEPMISRCARFSGALSERTRRLDDQRAQPHAKEFSSIPRVWIHLDRAISVILKKQEHARTRRRRNRVAATVATPIPLGRNVHRKATATSDVVHVVAQGYTCEVCKVVSGFAPHERFYRIFGESEAKDQRGGPKDLIAGYMQVLPDHG
jgi:hypothetical protein